MNILKLINKISENAELSEKIMLFFGEKITKRTSFVKFCTKNYIDLYPALLFDFFDTLNIKIAIVPSVCGEFWTCRIFTKNNITISNNFVSRKAAVLGSLERAVDIYFEKNPKNEKGI